MSTLPVSVGLLTAPDQLATSDVLGWRFVLIQVVSSAMSCAVLLLRSGGNAVTGPRQRPVG